LAKYFLWQSIAIGSMFQFSAYFHWQPTGISIFSLFPLAAYFYFQPISIGSLVPSFEFKIGILVW